MAATSLESCDVRWDLSDLFDSTEDPRIDESLAASSRRADELAAKYRGKLRTADAATLKSAILEMESLITDLSKPIQYASLRLAADTGDPKLGAFMQKMMEAASEIQVKLFFFELELQKADDAHIEKVMGEESLANYRHWMQTVRAASPYRLSEIEEVVLEKTVNTGSRAWVRLFEEVT